jgi:hypothetical protein
MLAGDLDVPTLIIEQPLPRTVPLRLMLRQLLKHFVLGGSDFPPLAHTLGVQVTAVSYWSHVDSTRISIEITGHVSYRSDRVQHPDRILFDIFGAQPNFDGRRLFSTEVGDKLLKRVRVTETTPGVTRVVLEVESQVEFSVSRLDNPMRMIIELRPVGTTPL